MVQSPPIAGSGVYPPRPENIVPPGPGELIAGMSAAGATIHSRSVIRSDAVRPPVLWKPVSG
ncbi:MAG: hypothetical protein CMJ23_01310 [Phycisphaerae bacterium]|nr:hypothetical protein [Phycisphaerae bacterium]